MKAMILAAGLGTRMRPLTDHTPKPLLKVGGKPLILHHIERLAAIGIADIVINVSHLAEQIIETLGDGRQYGVRIQWSREDTPQETGGGIRKALPLLGDTPFLLINGDVWCDLDPAWLAPLNGDLARLVLIDNPDHHPDGDFHLDAKGRVHARGEPRLTFAGISLIEPTLVADQPPGSFKLAPLLRGAMAKNRVSGCHHTGLWIDVGTPQRLQELDERIRHRSM